ncbi:beta-1,6-N-acetylglucosaminyltransferase [Robertmurraya korlensis]|uniref:beta-1,6-N-acetylglucosaminyltransferase n=1 Tax=Robertmurraya korlensis TaxID=519977 RepID=UPI0020402292|nr:beta-1,6-N-acetylglucosaminyltransferase [Robertmurraya korlensis]MCM3600538.1 beta-1,6-N-acetylglucosaminyltransferase [Robertmurraya korlensis]
MSSSLRTAFILQIHKNPEQVNKFIEQLIYGDQADVYIHIDQKSKEELNGKIRTGPNVTILNRSLDCEWGDISQVDTTLLLLREVLATKKKYDFVCLRSGQDLLINGGFKEYLKEQQKNIFLNFRKMERNELGLMRINWPKITRKRYTSANPIRIYRRMLLSLYRKGINIIPNKNKWPREFSFYKGSQWFTIPHDVASYIIEFLEGNEWYYHYFKNTLVPDESFFHTLIMNSPYNQNVINNNLYVLKWGETLSDRNSPQDLSIEDIPMLESSEQFFARKFDETKDPLVVQYITGKVVLGCSCSEKEDLLDVRKI